MTGIIEIECPILNEHIANTNRSNLIDKLEKSEEDITKLPEIKSPGLKIQIINKEMFCDNYYRGEETMRMNRGECRIEQHNYRCIYYSLLK